MGWLKRIFGQDKPAKAQSHRSSKATTTQSKSASRPASTGTPTETTAKTVPPERVGLNGEYDESGLAKRVALAFDEEPQLTDIDTLWIAQTSTTVVLKGKVPSQNDLKKMVEVAREVDGATQVDTKQVEVG